MKKTVLIIKLGYCETLVNEEGTVSSLGDVLRHTVLLHHYDGYRVTWLASDSTYPLLEANPRIAEVMVFDENTVGELKKRSFDEVLCLEKMPFLCNLAKSVKAKQYLGFGFTRKRGTHAHPGAESALDIANGKDQFLPIQALLFQMVGDYWSGEDYVLGYKPSTIPCHDVGFNIRVGSKWPSKAWPMKNWKKLEKLCVNHGATVSWQEGETDLYEYMDWIHSCKSIVTCDSLGMHLGLAMKKKVVALFGPTYSEQIYMYGRGVILTADWACAESPCMKADCANDSLCMSQIESKIVARTLINLLNGNLSAKRKQDCKTHLLRKAS